MIEAEYIIDDNKSLLTIVFNRDVLLHLDCKVDDYLNFYQSHHVKRHIVLFKADTGYRIRRTLNRKKTYQINVGQRLESVGEFAQHLCVYYKKNNGFIHIKL